MDTNALRADEYERGLLARANRYPNGATWHALSEDTLRQIAAREGMDFATALLFDRLVKSEEHGGFIELVNRLPDCGRPQFGRQPLIALVPGAGYVENPESGADGQFVRRAMARLGFPTELIPLRSFGSLKENAAIIRDWLRDRPDRSIILVSLSKGGAEVKLALAAADAAQVFAKVSAWISLSGIVQGTPLMNWLLGQRWRLPLIRLLFWYRGYHFPALREMVRGPEGLLDFNLQLPAGLEAIHVVGFPLVRHLSTPLARRGHRRMAPLGPNDGGPMLLTDLCRLPGLIYPVWGADHYLRPAWDINGLLVRLMYYLANSSRSPTVADGKASLEPVGQDRGEANPLFARG